MAAELVDHVGGLTPVGVRPKYTNGKMAKCWTICFTDHQGNKAVDGGMTPRQHPQQPITAYIDVPSVDEYAAKVEQLGGKVVVSKTAVPGFGHFAVCLDTEGNTFAIWEMDESAA